MKAQVEMRVVQHIITVLTKRTILRAETFQLTAGRRYHYYVDLGP